MRWQEWKWRRKGGTHRESLRPSSLQRSQTHSFVAQVDNALSWALLRAAATGVDFSPRAIALARPLAEELRLDTRFVCAVIYDSTDALRQHYDIDFTTY